MKRILLAVLCLFSIGVFAEGSGIPEFPGEWVNGGPYTKAGVAGKVVMMYFYEEG